MAKRDFVVSRFAVTSSSGTTALHYLTSFITEIDGLDILAELQETTPMGTSWGEHTFAGLRRMPELRVRGFYDDVAASGPHALFGQTSDVGASREFEADFGASDIIHANYVLRSYSRLPRRGELTGYEAVLQPSGAVTTAT